MYKKINCNRNPCDSAPFYCWMQHKGEYSYFEQGEFFRFDIATFKTIKCARTGIFCFTQTSTRGRPVWATTTKKIGGEQSLTATAIFLAKNRIVTARDRTTKSNNSTTPPDTKLNFVSTSTKMPWHASTTISAHLRIIKIKYSSLSSMLIIRTRTISLVFIRQCGVLIRKSKHRCI